MGFLIWILMLTGIGAIGLGIWLLARNKVWRLKTWRTATRKVTDDVQMMGQRVGQAAFNAKVQVEMDAAEANAPKSLGLLSIPLFLYALLAIFFSSLMVDVPQSGFMELERNFGGASMPAGQIIATQGENGPQAALLSPGLKWVMPFMYSTHEREPVVIPDGMIGVITTKAGKSMPEGVIYGPKFADFDKFLDAQVFLDHENGYKGQQVTVALPGTWKFHSGVYSMTEAPITNVEMGHVMVVKANYGEVPEERGTITITDLVEKEIALTKVELEAAYKDAENVERQRLLAAGMKEKEIKVDRKLLKVRKMKVELVEVDREIPDPLVDVGQAGIWREALVPNKYPMHPFAHEMTDINTMRLRISYTPPGEEGEDDGRVIVRSKDGYEFPMDIRIVYHVEPSKAPMVRAMVGDDEKIEDVVMTPAVLSISRVLAGRSNVLEFFADLELRQKDAKELIAKKCAVYGVTVDEVLIGRVGDEASLGKLMKTQRDREIAVQQQVTFGVQQLAAEKQKALNKTLQEAEEEKKLAAAAYQAMVAEQNKKKTITDAEAAAEKVTIAATAEAERIFKIKKAEADGYTLKVAALGPQGVAMLEAFLIISEGKIKITPNVAVSGGGANGGNNAFEALMAMMLQEKAGPAN